ncbi:MAG TPA: ATP-binding protein, partial [Saprospiraceae bacterium]|nr:ATP-binding protein [Saprospiraceae bacterium]
MTGRNTETEVLRQAFESKKPELVAVLGRRRVGKTFLVRSFFEGKVDFEMVGLKNGTKEQQLRNFAYSLKEAKRASDLGQVPADWLEAFHQLKEYLETMNAPERKKVVFIDELPWIATRKSDFLTGFGYFWNSYASRSNIIVVICGSATAWMISKILNDRGGLHNRVTRRIHLQPFSLSETEAYFQDREITFDRYQILLLYMALGGIPHYLDQVTGGKSAVQNIDEICFHPMGALRTEFGNLYSSLFAHPEKYEAVVAALSSSWKGLNRTEILSVTQTKDGGWLTTMLQELELSGFLSAYVPFGKKKKDTLYRLTDYYSLFYLKFIQHIPASEAGHWDTLSQTQSWKSWSGYAFENVCLQHIEKIKQALGISGIHTRQYSFWAKGDDENEGAQIDLLIDRSDNTITLCEMKFYNDDVVLNKEAAKKLRRRIGTFRRVSGTK